MMFVREPRAQTYITIVTDFPVPTSEPISARFFTASRAASSNWYGKATGLNPMPMSRWRICAYSAPHAARTPSAVYASPHSPSRSFTTCSNGDRILAIHRFRRARRVT